MTEQAETWFLGLDHRDRRRVAEAVDALVAGGPTLGRPFADRVAGSVTGPVGMSATFQLPMTSTTRTSLKSSGKG
jgi:hypothetical protein